MKIAVTGPRGRLASWLIAHYGCAPLNCDITDFERTRLEIHQVNPDVIIHAAAYTNVDKAEEEPELALAVNLRGTGNVRTAFHGYMVYLSTAYIFDGRASRPYSENEIPSPIQHYGWTKWVGEAAMLAGNGPRLIIRTMTLYGPGPQPDFVKGIVSRLCKESHLYLPMDLYGNPTYVPHLAIGIWKAIKDRLTGVLNLTGKDIVSRYEFAEAIARTFNLNQALLHQGEYPVVPSKVLRPKMAGLDLTHAKRNKIPIFSMKAGLREMKKQWVRE